MSRSLGKQLGAIFLGFLLLVLGSAAATFATVQAQTDDATVINVAGRQRMLSQRATWLAIAQPDNPELIATIQLFAENLVALREGGGARDSFNRSIVLPAAPNPDLQAQLDEVGQTWFAFQNHLLSGNNQALQTDSSLILTQLDSIVSAFEAEAQVKVIRLRLIQTAFLLAALLLLSWSYFVTRGRIIEPLARLSAAARRIGEGSLSDPVPELGDDELGRLATSFETMRCEVAAAHETLESRVNQRTQELAAAFEFSQEITRQLDLDHLLDSVTERARILMQADSAALCLLTPDGEDLELLSNSGGVMGAIGLLQSAQRGLPLQVIEAGQTTVREARCSSCDFLCTYPTSSCAAAPLRAGEQTLGALCVVRRNDKPFDEDETRAFTLLANSAAIAITNARLTESERRQAKHSAALAEREYLAADLHDNLAQTLSFLRLKSERIEDMLDAGQVGDSIFELKRMRSAISGAYRQVRNALTGLREPPQSGDDLAEKLSTCASDFGDTAGLSVALNFADDTLPLLPRTTQAQVLHIVREALANVRRHAQASQVQIEISQANGEARFSIIDDGRGFDPDSVDSDDHLGLAIMQARAQRSGGHLVIDSVPAVGTRVIASFPVNGSNHEQARQNL